MNSGRRKISSIFDFRGEEEEQREKTQATNSLLNAAEQGGLVVSGFRVEVVDKEMGVAAAAAANE